MESKKTVKVTSPSDAQPNMTSFPISQHWHTSSMISLIYIDTIDFIRIHAGWSQTLASCHLYIYKMQGQQNLVIKHIRNGAVIYRCYLNGIGIPIINIRRSRDRLIFIMVIPIPLKRHLYIETRPCTQRHFMISSSPDRVHGDNSVRSRAIAFLTLTRH